MHIEQEIWLIGGGGHARVVAATFQTMGSAIAGIFDSDPKRWGCDILGLRIVGDIPPDRWWEDQERTAFLSIGANDRRAAYAAALTDARWATAVHPGAIVHSSVSLGMGSLVCARVVIQPETKIGAHAIINTGAVVEHDNQVGDCCHVGPQACLAGNVRVSEGAFVGAAAVILPGVRVGAWSTIGAGAVVTRDVPDEVVAAGVPARVIGKARLIERLQS